MMGAIVGAIGYNSYPNVPKYNKYAHDQLQTKIAANP